MAGTSGMGFGVSMVAGAALAVVVAVGGYFTYQTFVQIDEVATPAANSTPAVAKTAVPKTAVPETAQPVTTDEPAAQTDVDPIVAAPTEPAPVPAIAPSFDVVRVETDGSSVIAGNAAPNAAVTILLDGTEIGQATADAQGNFVAMLDVPTGHIAQVLSLSSKHAGGDFVVSNDSVILAPVVEAVPEPEVVAQAEPAAKDTAIDTDVTSDASDVEPKVAETLDAVVAEPTPSPQDAPKPAAPTVLLANDEGVQVIQPHARSPEVMDNVVIDAISYDTLGEVQVSGRGADQSADSGFVRVYLNDAPIQTTPISREGDWHTTLPNVDTGLYVLRIDQVDASGAVTSRTQTPFKRETAEVLANAQVADPAQKVSAITVQPGSTLWAIARDTYGDGTLYVRVFEANSDSIRNPDLIYPGQVFQVPE